MLMRPLGASGIEASAVALGTWAIGGWMWGGTDEKDAVAAIQAAIDEGITLIDTAPIYGFGRSEELVGRAIAGRRDKVVLATKCGMVWDRERGDFFFYSDEEGPKGGPAMAKVYKYLGPESIRVEIERSLRRLGVDCIDLYQTHWQDSTTPIHATMETLLDLKAEGKIRAIGVCNASVEQIEEYRRVGPLDADQEKYSMLDRQCEATHVATCRRNGMAFLAYSPLALGLLTGKITPDRKFRPGDLRQKNPRFTAKNLLLVQEMLQAMRAVAEKHRITFAQLAIAWTIHQPGVTHALVGARSPKHAVENAAAGRVRLDGEDLAHMRLIIEDRAPLIQ